MTLSLGTPTTATGLASGTVSKDWKFLPLATDKGVYIYWDSGTSRVVGRVVTSSGTSISTIGSPTDIITESTAFQSWRPVKMSDTGFVVIYGLGTGGIKAVACTVAGTVITAGSQTVIDSAADINTLDDVFGARVADNKAIAVYTDRNNSTRGTATAFTVSGTTINTPGTPHVYESTGGNLYMGADNFSSDGTHVLATHIRSLVVYAIVLAVSGTTVSNGTEVAISAGVTTKLTARAVGLTATAGFVIYESASGTKAGKVRAVSRSGTTLTAGVNTVDWATDTGSNIPWDATRIADDLAILVFSVGTENKEKAIEILLNAGEAEPQTALTLADPSTLDNIGVAAANTSTSMVIYSTDQIAILSSSLATFSGYGLIQSSGGLAKPALAVSQDGDNVFIALEDSSSGNQIVFKATRPASPTVSAVYEPGAGSAANVIATGDPDKMVFFGNFGTDLGVLMHTINTGAESDISPTSIGADKIQPLAVDPSDINHIVAVNVTDQDLIETEDGSTWSTLNAALGQTPVAMAVMFFGALFPFGAFIGGNDGVDENLTYSPNEFANLREDTSAALKAVGSITGIDLVTG